MARRLLVCMSHVRTCPPHARARTFEESTMAVKGSSIRFPISRMPNKAQQTVNIAGTVTQPINAYRAAGSVEVYSTRKREVCRE